MFLDGTPIADMVMVRDFESLHGISFSASYLEAIKIHDGAYLSPSGIRFFDIKRGVEYLLSCDRLLSFSDGDMRLAEKGKIDGLPDRVIPFGVDGGGWHFCFDYRYSMGDTDPPIVIFIPEYEDEFAVQPLASTFTGFLGKLEPLPD